MLIDRNQLRAERPPQLGAVRSENPFEVIDLVIDELRKEKQDLVRQAIREGNTALIAPAIRNILVKNAYSVNDMSSTELEQAVFDHVIGYGPAQPWIDHPDFVGFFINDYDDVWVQLGRDRKKIDLTFGSPEHVRRYIERITGNLLGEINEDNPVGKFHDEHRNLRLLVAYPPIAYICPTVAIRKQPENPLDLDGLVRCGTLSQAMAADLKKFVVAGANIAVTGVQGAGKTTMLRAIAEHVPVNERMLVMEDHPELKVRRENTVHWLTKKLAKGKRVDLEQLTNLGLLGSFDYYVFGEIRDGDAFYFFNGAFAGNKTLNTGHAQSCEESLNRLRINMKMAGVDMADEDLMEILYKSVDLIIYMKDFTVMQIAEVNEQTREIRTLWDFAPQKGGWTKSGAVKSAKLKSKLSARRIRDGGDTGNSSDNSPDSACS